MPGPGPYLSDSESAPRPGDVRRGPGSDSDSESLQRPPGRPRRRRRGGPQTGPGLVTTRIGMGSSSRRNRPGRARLALQAGPFKTWVVLDIDQATSDSYVSAYGRSYYSVRSIRSFHPGGNRLHQSRPCNGKGLASLASGQTDFESEFYPYFEDNGQDIGNDVLIGAGKDRRRVFRISVQGRGDKVRTDPCVS